MANDDPHSERSWREIAEQVTKEQDSGKVTELSEELIEALEKETNGAPNHALKAEQEQTHRKSA